MFYVYEWFIVETGEIIYVGKGCRNRYKVRKHNRFFNDMIKRYECQSRIIKHFETEKEAFNYEYERVNELKEKGQCVCNIYQGGFGGETESWTEEKREWYSEHNCMKSETQRHRMSVNNPMKNADVAKRVGLKHRKPLFVGEEIFNTYEEVANKYNVTKSAVFNWLKRGYTPDLKPIYKVGENKPNFIIKTHVTNSCQVMIGDKIFPQLKQAAKYLNIPDSTLAYNIKKYAKYNGLVCKYVNQQPSLVNFDNSNEEGSTTNR